MKTNLITLCLLLGTLLSPAQEKKSEITLQLSSPTPDEIKVGWFDIDQESVDNHNLRRNSWAIGVMYNYNLDSTMSIRLRYGYNRFDIEEYQNRYDSKGWKDVSATGRQNKNQIAPGIIWKMKMNKLDLYGGFELPINFHGAFTMNYSVQLRDSLRDSLMSESLQKTIIPKGFSIGLGAVMGFNYHASSGFSLGAEFAPSLLYARLAGKVYRSLHKIYPDDTFAEGYTQDGNRGFTFYEQRFSLNIGFWF